jgi:hypothetical protein
MIRQHPSGPIFNISLIKYFKSFIIKFVYCSVCTRYLKKCIYNIAGLIYTVATLNIGPKLILTEVGNNCHTHSAKFSNQNVKVDID